ncbi:sulfite exporter TauE/SafE family protein [Pseudodesulfovibrio sp.]|uniref:urease accessory protein UreH domain-containing protein n=1 Tax=unclassified Pseudodesulfovibrio TaxID=2661612 RepID=UPI003AFF95E6
MTHDVLFLTALQGALLLGLIHGINPCGHSWLVLAPFTAGSRNPGRVARLTAAFVSGTSLACVAIGMTLGAISMSLPPSAEMWADVITFGVLLILGVVLLIKPTLLHHHDHDHEHGHGHCPGHDDHHEHDHAHDGGEAPGCAACAGHDRDHHHAHDDHAVSRFSHSTALGLFVFGFVNMIVPCPTAAIMYSYALRSGDPWASTIVFAAYALGTAVALSGVIWGIYRTTAALRALDRPWIEPLVMRATGVLVIAFAVYSLWATESATTVFPELLS